MPTCFCGAMHVFTPLRAMGKSRRAGVCVQRGCVGVGCHGQTVLWRFRPKSRLPVFVHHGAPVFALYHHRARAYDPVHGRFFQLDPAALPETDVAGIARKAPALIGEVSNISGGNTGIKLRD